MSETKQITCEEATSPTAPAAEGDPGYSVWKRQKIDAAVEEADNAPHDTRTHDQIFDRIKREFRS